MAEKKKIAAQFASRYRISAKHEKSKILDEYPAISGAKSRKYTIFKLNRIGKTQLRMLNGQAIKVAAVLESLWKNFNRPCGKLFELFLRQNLDLIRLREK